MIWTPSGYVALERISTSFSYRGSVARLGQTSHNIYGATPKIHTKEAIRSERVGCAEIDRVGPDADMGVDAIIASCPDVVGKGGRVRLAVVGVAILQPQ